jgi:nitrate reductase cytochrome c-type subunit
MKTTRDKILIAQNQPARNPAGWVERRDRMKAHILVLMALGGMLLAVLLLACTPVLEPVGEEEISLRKEGLQQTTDAPGPVFAGKDPGENKAYARAFHGAPPMIPHNLNDMEVGANTNDCLDCHEEGDKDTPGLPPSHRMKGRFDILSRANARNGQVTSLKEFVRVEVVSGNRYDCKLCHAMQAENAGSLVENTFTPVKPADAQKDILDALNAGGKF